MPDIEFFLFLDGFSSVVDKSWPCSQTALVEKVHKWGENGLLQEVITLSLEIGLGHKNSHWKYD